MLLITNMNEEKSEKIEDKKIQSESSELLQNINDNLTQIRTELEKFNRDKFRENVRLAVIIVLFAVPISFSLSVTSSFYGYLYFPEVNSGGIYGNIHGIIITGMAIYLCFVTIRIALPLLNLSKDHEVGKLIDELLDEDD